MGINWTLSERRFAPQAVSAITLRNWLLPNGPIRFTIKNECKYKQFTSEYSQFWSESSIRIRNFWTQSWKKAKKAIKRTLQLIDISWVVHNEPTWIEALWSGTPEDIERRTSEENRKRLTKSEIMQRKWNNSVLITEDETNSNTEYEENTHFDCDNAE